jgi:hypothetical protein
MKELGLRNGYLWELVRVKVWLNLDFFCTIFFDLWFQTKLMMRCT